MPIDVTHSKAMIHRSVKKFFVDTFVTGLSKFVAFDKVERVPSGETAWINVQIRNIRIDTLSVAHVHVWCFTTEDNEFTKIAELRDLVVGELEDLEQTDCRKRIPLYDASWAIIGYGVIILGGEYGADEVKDGTNAEIVPFRLCWGAK